MNEFLIMFFYLREKFEQKLIFKEAVKKDYCHDEKMGKMDNHPFVFPLREEWLGAGFQWLPQAKTIMW